MRRGKNKLHTKTLDLHGTKHEDVSRKVDLFIGEHLQKGSNSVEIITGFSQKMKKIVENTLLDYNLDIKEEPMNAGRVSVRLK